MKKRFYLLLALIALLVFSLPVLAKGGIDDCDAFDTYMGKTKAEVKTIAPYFKDLHLDSSDSFEIDSNDISKLNVDFGKDGKVESLTVFIDIGLSLFDDDSDTQVKILAVGLMELGVHNRELKDFEILDQTDFAIYFEDNIFCFASGSDNYTGIRATILP